MQLFALVVLLLPLLASQVSAEDVMSTVCPKTLKTRKEKKQCYKETLTLWGNAVLIPDHVEAVENVSGILMDGVVAHISPVGTFKGVSEVAEYLTILSNIAGVANIISPVEVNVMYYLTQGLTASWRYDILLRNILAQKEANLTIYAFAHFDERTNRVERIEADITRYGEWVEEMGLYEALNPAVAEFAMIAPTCQQTQKLCTGNLTQYDSLDDCLSFMRSLPLVDELRMAWNTVACRFLHSGLLASAPEIHCAHVGPTGGSFCTEIPYSHFYSIFTKDDFRN